MAPVEPWWVGRQFDAAQLDVKAEAECEEEEEEVGLVSQLRTAATVEEYGAEPCGLSNPMARRVVAVLVFAASLVLVVGLILRLGQPPTAVKSGGDAQPEFRAMATAAGVGHLSGQEALAPPAVEVSPTPETPLAPAPLPVEAPLTPEMQPAPAPPPVEAPLTPETPPASAPPPVEVSLPHETLPVTLPEAFGQCGKDWWSAYAELHRKILGDFGRGGGQLGSGRVLLYMVQDGPLWSGPFKMARVSAGISDRMAGIMTMFGIAVATNRAFLLHWPSLRTGTGELLVESPLLGESLHVQDLERFFRALPFSESPRPPPKAIRKEAFYLTCNSSFVSKWPQLADAWCWDMPFAARVGLKTVFNQAETNFPILAREGRGRLTRLIRGCRYNGPCAAGKEGKEVTAAVAWFRDHGLAAESAFGCFHDLLFQPGAPVRQAFAADLARLLGTAPGGAATIAPGAFPPPIAGAAGAAQESRACVTLQLRIGDFIIKDQHAVDEEKLLADAEEAFHCAMQAAKGLGRPPEAPEPPIVLMTDSVALKTGALRKYGSKVVTHNSSVIVHHAMNAVYRAEKVDAATASAGLIGMLGDAWLASHCGAHVVTKKSGVGRQVAARSRAFRDGEIPLFYTPCQKIRRDNILLEWSCI